MKATRIAPLGIAMIATMSLLAGCAPTPAPGILDAENDGRNPGQVVGVPVPDGQVERAVEQLDDLASSLLEESGIPGFSVAVVHEGETVFAEGYGVRKVGDTATVGPDTVFQLASMSKPIGATVVASQVGAGVIGWDTPVVDHLPWFELEDPWVTEHVTVGDLYSHRSGLPDHAGDLLEDIGYDRRDVLERLALAPLSPYRGQNQYTNFGLTAAAEAVAAASGTNWESLSQAALYEPLGMSNTSSRYSDFAAAENRAHGHVLVDGTWEAKYQRQPDAQSPAGGVSSTATDIATWMTMVLGEGQHDGQPVVDAEALRAATSVQSVKGTVATPDTRPSAYGFGFNVGVQPTGRVSFGHSGAFALGTGTAFTLVPSLDLGITVLTNAAPIGAAEALAAEFIDLAQYGAISEDWRALYAQAFGPIIAPVGELVGETAPADAAPSRDDAAYVGTYANEYFGDLTIASEGGELTLTLGPSDFTAALEPWDGDTLVFTPHGENAPDGSVSRAVFSSDAAGAVASVTLEFFDEHGLGTFVRVAG